MKGLSFLWVFGSYGGFHITSKSDAWHICLGWISFTVFFYDVENAFTEILLSKSDDTEVVECEKTDEATPLMVDVNKSHLVELYNFAYDQAVVTGELRKLKEIDLKMNGIYYKYE